MKRQTVMECHDSLMLGCWTRLEISTFNFSQANELPACTVWLVFNPVHPANMISFTSLCYVET